MSYPNPADAALAHPTEFSRTPTLPDSTSWGTTLTHGPTHPPAYNALTSTGVSRTDGRKVVGATPGDTNSQITRQYIRCFTPRAPPQSDMDVEVPAFISSETRMSSSNLIPGRAVDSEIFSLPALNLYLFSDEGRRRFGVHNTAKPLLEFIGWLGGQISKTHEFATTGTDMRVQVQSFVVGKRWHTPDVWRAQVSERMRNAAHVMECRYWLIRRYRDTTRKDATDYCFYYRVMPYKQFSGGRPPPCLYSDGTYTGACIYVGTVSDCIGGNDVLMDCAAFARKMTQPLPASEMQIERVSVPRVEIMVGL